MKKYIVMNGNYPMEYHYPLQDTDGKTKYFTDSESKVILDSEEWFYRLEVK